MQVYPPVPSFVFPLLFIPSLLFEGLFYVSKFGVSSLNNCLNFDKCKDTSPSFITL